MSENLIYGADICAYGAIGDGKTDCSDAFIRAIQNNESLISIPFGTYLIKKPIALSSNLKLHFHNRATVVYMPENEIGEPLFSCDGKKNIVICGGVFKCLASGNNARLFDFKNTECIRLSSAHLEKGIYFDTCCDVSISNLSIIGYDNAMNFVGSCRDITAKKITVRDASSVIRFGEKDAVCNLCNFQARDFTIEHCRVALDFFSGEAKELVFENISACFSHSFVTSTESFSLEDAVFEAANAHCSLEENAGTYFSLCGSLEGLEIIDFKRNSEHEGLPYIPTLIVKPSVKSTVIIDGMTLDNVIGARANSKTITMTTAKLQNPTGKYIYTLECMIEKSDCLTVPLGQFDSLTIFSRD